MENFGKIAGESFLAMSGMHVKIESADFAASMELCHEQLKKAFRLFNGDYVVSWGTDGRHSILRVVGIESMKKSADGVMLATLLVVPLNSRNRGAGTPKRILVVQEENCPHGRVASGRYFGVIQRVAQKKGCLAVISRPSYVDEAIDKLKASHNEGGEETPHLVGRKGPKPCHHIAISLDLAESMRLDGFSWKECADGVFEKYGVRYAPDTLKLLAHQRKTRTKRQRGRPVKSR